LIVPGTLFDSLPETWCCPLCEAPKEDFGKVSVIPYGLEIA